MDRPDPPPTPAVPPDPPSVELLVAEELPTPSPGTDTPGSPEVPAPVPVAAQQPAAASQPPHHISPIRTLANIAVALVIVFLFVRVALVEPFGVPTGSMAPALIGNHREGPCPRCGYPVRVGAPSGGGNAADHYSRVGCPNCGKRLSLTTARDINGDRLLVDKNVFNLRRPRRWEMAVFHCPDPDPKEFRKPYVKRVVGLPGESLLIVDGDVYADGALLRKGRAEVEETRVVVFDMAYAPEGGWGDRFLVEPRENDPRLPAVIPPPQPGRADSSVVKGGVLTLNAADSPQSVAQVTYRHWNLDENREEALRAWSSYDGLPRSFGQLPTAHDFSFTCVVEVASASADAVFTCGLTDGGDTVRAEVTVGSHLNGLAVLSQDGKGPLASIRGVALDPERKHHIEFSFVDRRAILTLNGREVLPPSDLPAAATRPEVRRPLQLGARGCKLIVRDLTLYRDTHYTQFGQNGIFTPDNAPNPARLGRDEYFMLGDNSGNSQDSRVWQKRDTTGAEVSAAGVPETWFIGKPFLIHQPLRPGRVTVGGRERVFQTVDWSRLRWLH